MRSTVAFVMRSSNETPGYRSVNCASSSGSTTAPKQETRWLLAGLGQVTDGFVESTKVLCGALVERGTRIRQSNRVGRPVDQLRVEQFLERGDRAAHRSLADTEPNRSLREAPRFCDCKKDREQIVVERCLRHESADYARIDTTGVAVSHA